VLGARAARARDLLAKRFARAKDPHAGIAARDAGLVGVVLDRNAVDLDAPERLGVFGLQRGGELADALAHDAVELVIAIDGLACEAFELATGRGRAPEVIGDRVAKHGVEPRGRVVADLVELVDVAHERVLQDLFCNIAAADATLHELEERAVVRDEHRNRFVHGDNVVPKSRGGSADSRDELPLRYSRMGFDELLSLLPLAFAALVPVCLIIAAFLISRQRSRSLGVASVVTTLTLVLTYLAVILYPILSLAGFDARTTVPDSVMNDVVQLDIVSGAMFTLVSTLAFVVVRYAKTYLAGQKELDRFARYLLLTLASVSVLVTSNSLAVLMVAWFATDIGLHQLLTFYRRRRQALIVAHKKFLLSRVADACFVASIVMIGSVTGSLRIDVVNAAAHASGELSPTLHVATVLLVFGVLLKSAQLPFHGWMQAVMEAPTPVSALLHAGIVNIGGFVMIRLAQLMTHAYIAQGILIGVGLFTTIVASLVMTSRAAIKGVLAWSTIGQMGFMLVQCGLGAWPLALMHLLAHSLYKAHTFLSAGSVVQQWRGSHLVHSPKAELWHLLFGAVLVSGAIAPFYLLTSLPGGHMSASVGPLALVLGLSFAPMTGRALAAGRKAFKLVALLTIGASASYFAGHVVFELLAPWIHADVVPSQLKWQIVVGGLILLFVCQSIMQTSPNGRFANWLQPHLSSGLYIDDWFTRVTFRLWPPGLQ